MGKSSRYKNNNKSSLSNVGSGNKFDMLSVTNQQGFTNLKDDIIKDSSIGVVLGTLIGWIIWALLSSLGHGSMITGLIIILVTSIISSISVVSRILVRIANTK